MIDEARLVEWERLAQAATPGPWTYADRHKMIATQAHGIIGTALADVSVRMHGGDAVANGRFITAAREAVPALLEEVRYLRTLLDPTPEQVERLAEAAHLAWMAEKQRQGFADHPWPDTYLLVKEEENGRIYQAPRCCDRPPEQHHPDMIPYAELPEAKKTYDRVMVQTVLAALRTVAEAASCTR